MTPKACTVAIPAFFYLAVTLGVPVLRGADSEPGFRVHAATVLVVVAAVCAARTYLPRVAFRAIGRATRPG
jgi:hypothetical protein